jgi:hypothetical protein
MVLQVLGQTLPGVDSLLELGVGNVARDDRGCQ